MPMSEVQIYSGCIILNRALVYLSEVGESQVGGVLHINLQRAATPSCSEYFSIAFLNLSDSSL